MINQLDQAFSILKHTGKRRLYEIYGDSYFDLDDQAVERAIDEVFPFEQEREDFKKPKRLVSRLTKGKPILQPLPVNLKDIYKGKTIKVKITRDRACRLCIKIINCKDCQGTYIVKK